ncbi:O-antigen ligase family protein [Uliginosibacterium paludis]|uniref:O-antigen ligase family protein n=1 Tax=Uliginosibacterium paludis TaxID=1615952 RepID=A0ABV2CUX5_9RHOO
MKETSSQGFKLIQFLSFIALLSILLANRAATKIGVGPIYLLDVVILMNVVSVAGVFFHHIRSFKYAAGLILMALLWMCYERSNDLWGDNNLRRAAMAFYSLLPALVITYGDRLYRVIRERYKILSLLVLLCTLGGFLENLQPTISSQVLAFFLLVSVFDDQVKGRKKAVSVLVVLICFLLVVSGVSSGGPAYRTPVIGLVLGLIFSNVAWLFNARKDFYRAVALRNLVGAAVLGVTVLVTLSWHPVVAQFIAGAAGLAGVEYQAPESVFNRERGDAAGTAETRTVFWKSIIENAKTSDSIMLIGNGHFLSFFEKTKPYEGFVDEDLLEPHNSFMGMFYRYGLIGLGLLLAFVFSMRRKPVTDQGIAFSVATATLAIVYCFFEVALESPHGALVFWLVWLAPIYFSKKTMAANF